MNDWLQQLDTLLADGPVAVITVLSAEGSTPRDAGARMLVTSTSTAGTIGGGALEYTAITDARAMLQPTEPWQRRTLDIPLGPALQQCCGGFVRLLIEAVTQGPLEPRPDVNVASPGVLVRPITSGSPWQRLPDRRRLDHLPLPVAKAVKSMLIGEAHMTMTAIDCGTTTWLIEPIRQPRTQLYLYGAGHVARDVVTVLDGLAYDITWVDVARERFPATVAAGVTVEASADPVAIARAAPPNACHVVMTFSHALDEAITHALLEANTFAYLGLIGSETKRARFVQRFRRAGIAQTAIARLTCPIGLPEIPGKDPRAIAIALTAQLLQVTASRATASQANHQGTIDVRSRSL